MEMLFDPLLRALETGNWGIVFLVVAVALIFNLRAILDFFEHRRQRREEFVKEALKIDALTDASRSIFEEELNYLLFKKITGISANRALREKLKDIVDRSAGEVQLSHLCRVKNLLRMKSGKLSVVVSRSARFEWGLNWLLAIAMALFALTFFMLPSALKGVTLQQLGSLMTLGMLFFVFALFLVSQTVPVSTAKWLGPLVTRLESASTENDN
ncbi:hypothetical protein ACLBKS_10070 [Hylemonella sp. W303a]|uniref:hypothetical protein n=1 Tax=Hylemonella sp. W303a TaxID=3389873 RepID=UPI00396B101B